MAQTLPRDPNQYSAELAQLFLTRHGWTIDQLTWTKNGARLIAHREPSPIVFSDRRALDDAE